MWLGGGEWEGEGVFSEGDVYMGIEGAGLEGLVVVAVGVGGKGFLITLQESYRSSHCKYQ